VGSALPKDIGNLTRAHGCVRGVELFGSNSKFYEDLDLLRLLRNRVHIQNRLNKLEPDEADEVACDHKHRQGSSARTSAPESAG
jgi:hypothetical protein